MKMSYNSKFSNQNNKYAKQYSEYANQNTRNLTCFLKKKKKQTKRKLKRIVALDIPDLLPDAFSD